MAVQGTHTSRAMAFSPVAFARMAWTCRVLVVPAVLYAVNNYLKFILQLFFKPTSAKMLGNLKVLTIAVLMRVVLGRRFSLFQWEALYLLVAGITINQLANCDSQGSVLPSLSALGVVAGTVTVPSLASVFNEYGFKQDLDTSILNQVCRTT
jgi:Nucleotide-sugar transporter